MKITLKAARVNQNLTQTEAGKRIGVSKDVISAWERGVTIPSVESIPKIEETYDCKYDDLIFLPTKYA